MIDLQRAVPASYCARFATPFALPAFPQVIQRALALLGDDNGDLTAVSSLLAHDAVISARLMQLSDCAALGGILGHERISTIVSLLGTKRLRAILVSFGVIAVTQQMRTIGFSMWSYWVTSATVAHLAQALAQKTGLGRTDIAFTVGIVRNIGRITMAHVVPDLHEKIARTARKQRLSYHESAHSYGCNDTVMGAWVAAQWGLLPVIISAIDHDDNENPASDGVPLLIRAARAITALDPRLQCPGDFDEPLVGEAFRLLLLLGVTGDQSPDYFALRNDAYEQASRLIDCTGLTP